MKRNRSLHDKMIERNWVLKRKRKRLPSGSELSKGKDGISTLPLESPANSASSKQRLKDDFSVSQSTHKKKGNDGHYYECVICDVGGNLLCCDSCPRTYHLQCLNPPLKRTPHGKWHCPNCCEQKDSVISSTPVETVSKRARTNIITEKSKSGVKASGSRKLSIIVRASSLGKKRSSSSSKEKCAFTCLSPPLEKKSVSDQMNISSGTKSTSLSSDDASAKPPSLISNKETQTSSRSMDSEPEAEIGSPLKKLILHLHRPGQKSRKNGEKVNKADHQKRKSKTDNGKSVGVTLGEDGSKVSSAGTGMKNRRKRTSVDRQKSKEGPGMRKLVVQEYTKKPFERKKSSNQKDEVDSKTDNVIACEESILEAVQQVDRILGCRLQSYVANNQSTKLASDDRVNIENARNLPGAGFDISTSHVCSEEVTEKETGVNKMDVEGISIIEECCKKADLLASTSVPVKDQSPTAIKSETHTHEEAALIAVDIMDVPVGAGTTMAEDSRDANDASLEARSNRTTETNVVKMGPSQTEKVVYEFLVKWVGRSHIHNTWVDESLLKVLAKRKLENYKAKYGTTVINICQEQWEQPQRVIALRNSKEGIKEALVKWCGLPYDECTWERLDQPIIEEHFHLISEFEQFEIQTQVKDTLDDVSSASKGDQMEIFPLTEQPKELRGSLFPHQLEALNWLRKCWYRSKNVILADEMGLGKTVSAAAFMSSLYLEFKAKLPCLVLVPLSTMPNWVAEFVSWAPHLNVVEYHGSAKARSIIRQYEWHASNLSGPQKSKTTSYKFHVLLTTYEMVLADSNHLRGVPWAVLIVDEGHRLKNSSSKLFSLLNTFSFQHRVLLTGTPLQNNLGEMYNLLNFLQPASFPSLSCFEEKFNDLTTAEKVEELKKLVAPHMLRRLKKDAMQNIPPKTERMVPVELTSIQAEYYRAMLTKNYQVLRNIGKGVAQQSMLNIVMQLRKVCNHPYLIPGTEPESGSIEFLHEMRIKASAKLTLLHSMLKIMNKEGHRVLIFSQMTKLLDILEDYLTVEFGPKTFERVDGSVSVGDRQAAIARFNQDQSRFVFLLSTRSCGLGINLATADTVIIYDSDFNPHADIQAMNRAHRIGQSKRLLVYRLVVRASVEERILQLAKKKLMLDQLFVNKSGSQKEVEDILRWGTEELFSYLSSDRDGKNATNGISKSIPEVGEETEQKHRRRGGGGLGDVYQDKCTDGDQRIIWDETAILRLLDRSNLDNGSTESAEADLDHDMLGSVKSLEWNDEQTEDQGAIETLPGITGDVEQTSAKKDDPVINVTEENEWDRLLRVRWEKYQNEEEASLGRGKRLRKAVSYKEVFAAHQSDALSESGNEEDEPGPEPEREVEYTPAGRALKAKYAKLRARQKERLAQRHLAEASCSVETNLAGPESVPQFHSTEGNASHIKSIDAVMDQAPQINLEDEKSSQASETIAADKNAPPSRNKGTTHVYRTIQGGPRLDSSFKPPDNVSPNIFLPAHQFQNTSFGGNSMPSTIRGPILGLCAPNAYLRDSAPKTFQSYLHPQRSSSQSNESGMRIPEFPSPLAPCASTSINIGSGPESMANISALPDTSEVLHHLKSTIQEGRFSYQPCPPSTSRGRGPINPLEVSGNRFSSFQEKMVASNLFLDEMLLPKVQFHHKNVSNSSPDLLPSLSLNMKGETMTHSIQEFPIMPLLPNFRFPFSENPKQNQHNLKEPQPVLGLGQMQPTYPSLPENHRKVLDNILMRTGAGSSKLKKRLKTEASWSEDELDTLWIGVRRHGRGNWDSMLIDPKLKFSKYRTPENLSERWEQEQLKILDGLAFPVPKPGKSTSFPCLSDGMMTRALFGSRFAGVGVPEQYGPPKFQSHLTDIQLGYGDLASSFSQLERTDHFGQMNEHLPTMPGWKHDKFRSSNSVASHAGPSDKPGSSTLPLEAPHLPNLLTDNLLQKDELCANKYLKLPTLLDRSLNWLRDSQNNKQSGESKPMSLPDLGKKPSSGHSPITENASGGSSSVNKLPHWLREAVSVPSKPPEPKLPPTVSAIAQSVRLLYGEERPTIPPFTVPGPLPFRPKDPRKSLKKKKLRKLGRVTPEVCSASSIPQAPSFPMMPTSTASSLGLPCIEPKLSLPSLNLNILNASSSASIPSNGKKSGLTLLPSPEVLHLVSSCVTPSPHLPSTSFVPDAPEMKTGFEQFELPEKIRSLDTVKGARGKRKARSSPLGSWGKFAEDPVADSTVSGDSESCGVRPEVEVLSSEETLSDDQQSEPE